MHERTAPLYDLGNRLLADAPSEFTTGQIASPSGNRIIFTVRTSTTTLSVTLDKDEAAQWAKMMQAAVEKFSETMIAPEAASAILSVG